MDILLDLNIVIDKLIPQRKGHQLAREIDSIIKKEGFKKWVSASSVDNLQYILLSEAKRLGLKQTDKIRLQLRKFIEETKIFSVSGKSIRQSLDSPDLEDYILYTNFKRIAPNGIIISRDKEFQKLPGVISPESFLTGYKRLKSKTSIPLLDLREQYRYLIEDIEHAILTTSSEARYILGQQVKELEQEIAGYIGVKHAIGVSSGTDALVMTLRALAILKTDRQYWQRDDLVITTPFTFTATGDAILRSGATPLFVDIDPDTYNLDPQLVKAAIEKFGHRVRGILPVHLYGQPCRMDEIMAVARENDLFVVEDCAQSLGAKWKGQQTGSFGDAGCFSFFPSKPLGGFGDGGMITTNSDELYEILLMLRKHGGRDKYNVDHIGYNARLDTLQAAVLLTRLRYLDDFAERRRKIGEFYNNVLGEIDSIKIPYVMEDAYHIYHQYTIRCTGIQRDTLKQRFAEKGISSMVYYPVPLHRMRVFKEHGMEVLGNLTNAETASQEVLSLPIEPLYDEELYSKVVEAVHGDNKD